MIVVCDIEKSKAFYKRTLGSDVILDFSTNVTLTGGIALQTTATYANFINQSSDFIELNGCDAKLYFKENSFDEFIGGQRVVRFYDPDGHIIEVGETISAVCKRCIDSEISLEETACTMDVPVSYVISMLN